MAWHKFLIIYKTLDGMVSIRLVKILTSFCGYLTFRTLCTFHEVRPERGEGTYLPPQAWGGGYSVPPPSILLPITSRVESCHFAPMTIRPSCHFAPMSFRPHVNSPHSL